MRNFRNIFAGLALFAAAIPAFAAPRVLVTIKPVHSLAAAVMQGVGEPDLLVGGGASVHSYALKPSDARKIENADLIFEVGPDLETWLTAPLKSLAHGKTVALASAPGMRLLPARQGGLWEDDPDHDQTQRDPHLWLDPMNAIAMTHAISAALVKADPPHAKLYRDNEVRTVASLVRLDGEIKAALAPLHGRSYLVFHDAYQYLETRYGLTPAGSVSVAPDRPAGPRRIVALRKKLAAGGTACLFREPQFPPRLVETLREGTRARIGVLDPLGAGLAPGPDLYPRLMRELARSLKGCLG
jgi:zinc transport system substrate-binding protein